MPLRPSSADDSPAPIAQVDAEQHLARAVGRRRRSLDVEQGSGVVVASTVSASLFAEVGGDHRRSRARRRLAAGDDRRRPAPRRGRRAGTPRRRRARPAARVLVRACGRSARSMRCRFVAAHAGHRLVEQHQARPRSRARCRPRARAARRATARRCGDRALAARPSRRAPRALLEERRLAPRPAARRRSSSPSAPAPRARRCRAR